MRAQYDASGTILYGIITVPRMSTAREGVAFFVDAASEIIDIILLLFINKNVLVGQSETEFGTH